MKSFLAGCLVLLASGCQGALGVEGSGGGLGGGNGTGGGSAIGGGTGVALPTDGGLPCEVATVVSNSCASCHGATPAGGAPMSLVTRADFLAPSARDATQSNGVRSVARMHDATAPMPSSGLLPAAQVDPVTAWVTAGMPEGSCAPVGPPMLTCASGSFVGGGESSRMAPGLACISCHSSRGEGPIRQYMGTVFVAPHEKDNCAPALPLSATVEILQADGVTLVATLTVNSGGNFYGNAPSGAPATYRARVVTSQGSRMMMTPQTSGDCNTCHTAEGLNGAPGRIFLP